MINETEEDRAEGYTGKEMCETIVEAFKKIGVAPHVVAQEIWNYSPTGELFEVLMLHDWAMVTLGRREKSVYSELGENNE
ncbi:unnamed protein product [marine sediment metagenome]|uniref:Uncharacterized protein n=1 Tax=marine sediment metagenome TaxID=412755 RepID=X0VLR5_9ZZZZ